MAVARCRQWPWGEQSWWGTGHGHSQIGCGSFKQHLVLEAAHAIVVEATTLEQHLEAAEGEMAADRADAAVDEVAAGAAEDEMAAEAADTTEDEVEAEAAAAA